MHLISGILCVLLWMATFDRAHADSVVHRIRPYTLDDYFAREDFVALTVAPRGHLIAVERKRPATVGESYVGVGYSAGDYRSRRSDIWVLDGNSGAVVWRTDGKAAQQSSFAASWSPNGSELAFLQSGPTGRISLTVWDAETRKAGRIDEIDVDLTVLLTRGVSAAEDSNSFFLWSDDSRLFVAGRGSMRSQPLGTGMLEDLSSKWHSTWQGNASMRIWDSQSPALCNEGVRLYEVSAYRGEVVQIFEGAILGVSVAPNARRLAVVSALPGLIATDAGPLGPAASRRVANRSEYGRWQVDLIDRSESTTVTRTVASGTGDVGKAVLPRWSGDAQRLAVVTGNEPQRREYATLLFDFKRSSTVRVAATSLVDAEVLAALYAVTGVEHLDSRMWLAPSGPIMIGDGIRAQAEVYSLGNARAAVADDRGVTIVSQHGPVQLLTATGRLVHIAREADGTRIYWETDSGVRWADASETDVRIGSAINLPPNGRFAGVTNKGKIIAFGDTEDGSFIWSVSGDGGKVPLARANGHMAGILIPKQTRVKYEARAEDREGILYLPTAARLGAKPPVVVTAYPMPDALAVVAPGLVGDINSVFAWHWHPMLAAGFAIYVVDFRRPLPVDVSSKAYVETPELILSEVVPAVKALELQSEVDSTRLGFAGFSQGGYTALTLLGRTTIFSAIAAEMPLANLATNLSATPELRLLDCAPAFGLSGLVELEARDGFIRLGGPPYLTRERMVNNSPLFNLEKAATPTLLFAAELDPYAASGAEQTYMMLLRKGVPTQLVTYWGENHNIGSPGNIRDMINREIYWFSKYLKN